LARLRSLLLLTLVTGVLAAMVGADVPSSLFDTWGYFSDTEQDTSNTITADTLGAPGTPDATDAGVTSVNLTWTASNDSYATGYRLFRRTDPGVYGAGVALTEAQTNCVTPGDSSCAYTDTGLTGATTYCYKLRTTYLNWTSAETAEDCATTQTPVEFSTLKLNSPNGSINTLVTGTATGSRTVNSKTNPPFEFVVWNTTSEVEVMAAADWTLTLDLVTTSPNLEGATLVVELTLHTGPGCTGAATTIATGGPFTFVADGAMTLNAAPLAEPKTGYLCLKITNESEDSGAAHDARIVTTGGSTLFGPVDTTP
jgi:hypothetical protein